MQQKESKRRSPFTTRSLTASAVSIAIAVALSMITLFPMPQGGSVHFCTMLFVALPGYFFGPVVGLVSAMVYGLIDFILKPYFYHPMQFLLDYILGFGVLGVTGFFANRKYGLYNGYVLGVVGRFIFSTLSGVIFFYMYAGDQNVWIYSMGYQITYLGPEAAITIILLAVPVVQSGIDRVKRMFAPA